MKDFILENYRLIILCGCAFLQLLWTFILSLIGNKKSKRNEPFYQVIAKLPSIISKVEELHGAGNGAEKKAIVLSLALSSYKVLTGIELSDDSKIARWIGEAIEEILKTPQKKGGQIMTRRSKISRKASKGLFKRTANKTNVKNIVGARSMMRGGFHF